MTIKSWFLSWFGLAPATDAAPSSPALYVAGPVTIERDGEGYRVAQQCGTDSRGGAMARSWSFASAAEMKKQLEEFGGAATSPELRAELELVAPAELDPIASDSLAAGS